MLKVYLILRLGADLAPVLNKSRSLIESEFFVDTFRDIQIRFDRYFTASNSISVSLSSMVEIMLSQINKIEKNIDYLENYIDNFDFISGNDDLYNFSYIENFDNLINSNQYESNKVQYIDRGGASFSENGDGYIDPVTSKFKIGSGINFINTVGLVNDFSFESNYDQYISSVSPYETLLSDQQSSVWNVSIKSPTVLTSNPVNISSYVDYDFSYLVGAKSILTINFIKEVEIDTIRINPNDFNGLQLMQVVIETSDSTEKTFSSGSNNPSSGYQLKKLLNSPLKISSTLDVSFPLDRVRKVIFVFNQSTYTKSSNSISPDEQVSRAIGKILSDFKNANKKSYSSLQNIVLEYFKKTISIDEAKRNTYAYTDYYSDKYPAPLPENLNKNWDRETSIVLDEDDKLMSSSAISQMIKNIVSQMLGVRFSLFRDSFYLDSNYNDIGGGLSRLSVSPRTILKNSNDKYDRDISSEEKRIISGSSFYRDSLMSNYYNKVNTYDYSFSIKSIQFGVSNQVASSTSSFSSTKACFISSKILVEGEPLALKAKVNLEKNVDYKNAISYDLTELNSYELSVSLKEFPSIESDWIPIASYESDEIKSEVLFVDQIAQTATLRFYPIETSIVLYENQKIVPTNLYSLNKYNKTIYIQNHNPKSVYIVSYTLDSTNYSQSVVDFTKIKSDTYTTRAYTNDINGELFQRTGSNNTVKLKNSPYIDASKFTKAAYSPTQGTVNSVENIGYTPVSIKLSDGSYAINLTNYISGSFEKANFYESSETLFFQNGKYIIFNKSINEPFTVAYNYLNSQVRFRLIVRNNFTNYFSPGSVDNVIIKFKTKNSDNLANKLLKLG